MKRLSLSMDNGWTLRHYRWLQAAFGLYLAIHFAHLVPWGAELFSNRGMIARAADSPVAHVLPNVLTVADDPWTVRGLLLAGVALAAALATGVRGLPGRVVALALWYLWACLHARNPLIGNPGLPYVGWMLLAHALILPARDADGNRWRFPRDVFAAAWILMALGYTYSGVTKLASPSWLDGNAIRYILENPLARPGTVRDALLSLPDALLHLATWGTLGLELLALPLTLWARARPWLWAAFFLLHLGLLVTIDFADLTFGMVVLHLFTFDPAWLGGWLPRSAPFRHRFAMPSPKPSVTVG